MQVVTSEQGCVGIVRLPEEDRRNGERSFETSCRELLDSGAKKVGGSWWCRIHQFRRVTVILHDG